MEAGVGKSTNQRRRGAFRLLLDPNFGSFFWGKLATASAVYLHSVVAAIVTFEATGSALAVALVTVAQFAPQLLLAPLAGSRADKGNLIRQIIIGRLVCAIGSAALAGVLLSPMEPTGWSFAWVVIATSVVTGLGLVTGGPAMQAVTPHLVRPVELPTAMTLNTAPMTMGRVIGPASGALMVHFSDPAWAFVAATTGHLLFVAILPFIKIPRACEPRPSPRNSSMRAALRVVARDRPLMLLLLAVATLGFACEPFTTLAPILADRLGGGSSSVGAMTAGFGAGAVVGVIASSWMGPRLPHERVCSGGIASMTIGLGACAAAPNVGAAVAANAVAGFGLIVGSAAASTMIQVRIRDDMRGRVMALWLMGFVGSRPIAALVTGSIADLTSPQLSLSIVSLCALIIGIVCRPSKLRDNHRRTQCGGRDRPRHREEGTIHESAF
ncbi:MFS transporter [Rhodococcus sp. NPDC127530]|uniref:MFS transporter n=1 Tax=unclassified Rhodococcus (in: high G+C Gram-positive bacteria) TaxID=192944 RepID=UPI00363C324C